MIFKCLLLLTEVSISIILKKITEIASLLVLYKCCHCVSTSGSELRMKLRGSLNLVLKEE